MSELNEIGIKYNTDKASEYKSNVGIIKGHDYLKRYELFFSTMKYDSFTIAELGCYTGASLKMWAEYFPNANIIGVDLDENLSRLETDKIKFICSNATADDLPNKITENIKLPLKCIIDDCSHAWGDQRYSFEILFPIIESGGYYIIEDLECGSMGAYSAYPPKHLDSQVFYDYAFDRTKILRVSERRNPIKFRPFFYELPKFIQDIELSIDMVTYIPGAIIFKKK